MRKDRWTDMKKLLFAFHNFAKALKNIPRMPSYKSLPVIVHLIQIHVCTVSDTVNLEQNMKISTPSNKKLFRKNPLALIIPYYFVNE